MATLERDSEIDTRFDVYLATCPSRELLDLVTSRWAVLIVIALGFGAMRFGSLKRQLAGISPKVLTEKLRLLEEQDLVRRTVIERPLAVEYELTPAGFSLLVPLSYLRKWAEDHCDQAV